MGGGWACTCCWADSLALHQKQQEEQRDLGGSHFQFWTPSAKHCHWHHFVSAFQLLTLCVSRHRFAQNSELTFSRLPHFFTHDDCHVQQKVLFPTGSNKAPDCRDVAPCRLERRLMRRGATYLEPVSKPPKSQPTLGPRCWPKHFPGRFRVSHRHRTTHGKPVQTNVMVTPVDDKTGERMDG